MTSNHRVMYRYFIKININILGIILFFNVYTFAQTFKEVIGFAKEAYNTANYEKALVWIDKAISLKPGNSEGYSLKGKIKIDLDKYNEAYDCFIKASSILPQEPEYHFYKGVCELKLKRYNLALKSIDEALIFSPDNLLGYYFLANVYYEMKVYASSKENFDKAIDLDPHLSVNMFVKRRLIEEYGEYYKIAVRICNREIKRNPLSGKDMFYRSILKAMTGDNWGAYIDIAKSIELDPATPMFYFYKGYVECNIKKFKESLEDLNKYTAKFPQDKDATEMVTNIMSIANIKIVNEESADNQIYLSAEKMPEFNGGIKEMFKYLSKNIRYPQEALDEGIDGRVVVSFVVDTKGNLRNIEVLKPIGGGCEEEAVRVIRSMPAWQPGLQGGKRVNVKYTLPISFTVSQ